MDTNYLRSALKTAGAEQASTCTLCGAIVNLPYEEAHKVVHQGDYEPFAVDAGVTVDTCRLCGILVDRSYQEAHDRSHA